MCVCVCVGVCLCVHDVCIVLVLVYSRTATSVHTTAIVVCCCLHVYVSSQHCKELFETIIGKGQTIREVKEVILDTAKEKEVDLGICVDR